MKRKNFVPKTDGIVPDPYPPQGGDDSELVTILLGVQRRFVENSEPWLQMERAIRLAREIS